MKTLLAIATMAFATVADGMPKMEVSAIVDTETVAYYGSEAEAQKAVDATIEYAARIYKEQIGIELSLSRTEFTDSVAKHTHPEFLMQSVKQYRADSSHRSADVTVLFTVRKLKMGSGPSYAGYATVGQVCDASASAVVSLQHDGLDGQTLAHEIGHTAGAPHDGDKPCENESATGWLMAAKGSGPENFSQCSIDKIKASVAYGDCLKTQEQTTFTPPPPTEAFDGKGKGGGGAFDWILGVALTALAWLKGWRKDGKERIRIRFKGDKQRDLILIWREYWENGDVVYACHIWGLRSPPAELFLRVPVWVPFWIYRTESVRIGNNTTPVGVYLFGKLCFIAFRE